MPVLLLPTLCGVFSLPGTPKLQLPVATTTSQGQVLASASGASDNAATHRTTSRGQWP
ncbi:hypothetical protein ABT009_07510 [Streptomyces sp. NPDC002896]|uniref:hypothetical protein n=1 Tax=Streptomyces sp. NPDC002896 TaxID=3154438 RepID=UPI00332D2779